MASSSSAKRVVSSSVRQIHSKNVAQRFERMRWSNRMDLMAVSNDKAEVIIYRLNLQKTWVYAAPLPDIQVRGLDWRPDEKIVAVGYSDGWVVLLDIENHQENLSLQLESGIECLNWTQNYKEIVDDSDSVNPLNNDATYLPPLPSFSSLTSNAPKADYNAMSSTYSKKVINILIIGLTNGIVQLFAFGVLSCGKINVPRDLGVEPSAMRIVDARMSADFRQLLVTVLHLQTGRLELVTYTNDMLKRHLWPLLQLAAKHGHILNTMLYIDEIIQCITEAWETALLEMDNMLDKYANAHPDGSVSADFLDLLVYGNPSEDLEDFLTRDLTEKGLKKLGSSIEISYTTIQKLVIKPLHSGILNVCYHLNTIKGMARNTYYYRPLIGGPSNEALQAAGAFLIKSLEMQQTIEQSTRDYKLFWCWLYGVVVRLMEETVPEDISAFSQQDIIYLADFLNSFDDPDSGETYSEYSEETATKEGAEQAEVGKDGEKVPTAGAEGADKAQAMDVQSATESDCEKDGDDATAESTSKKVVQSTVPVETPPTPTKTAKTNPITTEMALFAATARALADAAMLVVVDAADAADAPHAADAAPARAAGDAAAPAAAPADPLAATADAPTAGDPKTEDSSAEKPASARANKRFNLERVGQYLQHKALPTPSSYDLTQRWHQLLDENDCLKQCDLLYPHNRANSLVQQHALLKSEIDDMFARPEHLIGSEFRCTSRIDCALNVSAATQQRHLHRHLAHVNNAALACSFTATLCSPDECVIVESPLEARAAAQRLVRLSWLGGPQSVAAAGAFADYGTAFEFLDIAFYNEDWLAMLLVNAARAPGASPSNSWLMFNVRTVRDRMVGAEEALRAPALNMYECCEADMLRRIEHGDAWRMAVSGSRKLVTVVSDSGRRVRIFETEVDEDDDDEEGLEASQDSSALGDATREEMMSDEDEDEPVAVPK